MTLTLIFVIVTLLLGYILWTKIHEYNTSCVNVKSTIDQQDYCVQPSEYSQEAANTLATLKKATLKLIECTKRYDPEFADLVARKYVNVSLSEPYYSKETTSYTVSKKDIYMCINTDPEAQDIPYELNTLMYVYLHELAHVISSSEGHTEEWSHLFRKLLDYSEQCGIYRRVSFKQNPVSYCGLVIDK